MRAAMSLIILLGALAAEPRLQHMTLEQAVVHALAHHPRIRAAVAAEQAAAAGADEAGLKRLPHAGLSAELNRSTGNTAPGTFFYAEGLPPIAGAPRGRTFDSGAWQTGVGAWAQWDALSLLREASSIDAALAVHGEAHAEDSLARLEVGFSAADAFLLLLEAQETVRAALANIDRAQTVETVVKTLVTQNLRPGADAARVEAELAAAQTLLARSAQSVEIRRAQLAQALGDVSLLVEAAPGHLLDLAASAPDEPERLPPTESAPRHPALAVQDAVVAGAEARQRKVTALYLPRFDLVASLWARGSGYFASGADGLAPDIPNWGAGAVVSWPLLDVPALRARAAVAEGLRNMQQARREEVALAVSSQLAEASAQLRGARRVAWQAAIALASARTAEAQTLARFKTGLTSVVDVADAQRLLAQVEIDDAVARLEVHRARLLLARAAGDLGPFLRDPGGG
jgi:outer membrane protein TolC